jgi:hypothetical protein
LKGIIVIVEGESEENGAVRLKTGGAGGGDGVNVGKIGNRRQLARNEFAIQIMASNAA